MAGAPAGAPRDATPAERTQPRSPIQRSSGRPQPAVRGDTSRTTPPGEVPDRAQLLREREALVLQANELKGQIHALSAVTPHNRNERLAAVLDTLSRTAYRIVDIDAALQATPHTRPGTPADAAHAPTGAAAHAAEARRAGLFVRPRALLASPSRYTIDLLGSGQRSFGPSGPNAVDTSREVQVSGQPMRPARHAAILGMANRAIAELHPVDRPERGLPSAPLAMDGMSSEAGFRSAVGSMFGAQGANGRIADRVLRAAPPSADGPATHSAPLVLATAFKAVGADTAELVGGLLDAAARGKRSPALFRLERVLAASASGAEALGAIRGLDGQAQAIEHLREGLNLCSDLERRGLQLDGCASAGDVLHKLEFRNSDRMDKPIGSKEDAPLQLLAKALRHSQSQATDGLALPIGHDYPAYVAWKKGGFTTSGKDTDFNRMIGRLHKFMTYVDRIDHGPRTIRNLTRDAIAALGRTAGIGKSPLMPMRHGTLGGSLGLRREEAARATQSRNLALDEAVDQLVGELGDPHLRPGEAERDPRLARAATLALWRETGQTKFSIAQVADRARGILREAGDPYGHPDEAALKSNLSRITQRTRTADGQPGVRVGIRALEALGASGADRRAAIRTGEAVDPETIRAQIETLRARPDRSPAEQSQLGALQRQRRLHLTALLKDLRAIEKGSEEGKPTFRLSDLKTLIGADPRDGHSAEWARQVMQDLVKAKYYSYSTFSDGAVKGLNTFGALPVASGVMGVPLVIPVLQALRGRQADIGVGLNSTSARLFIGTARHTAGEAGVGGGWAAPPLAGDRLSAVVGAVATASRTVAHSEGAAILARRDKEGWQEKLPAVVDFMFDQSRLRGADRARDAGAFWTRFAQAFGNDEHITVGWSKDHAVTHGATLGGFGALRVAAGEKTRVGPAVGVGVSFSRTRFERSANADGGDVPAAVLDRRAQASAGVTLTQTTPSVSIPEGPLLGWGAAPPLVGASVQWDAGAGLGVASIGRTREGKLSPGLCTREVLFRDPAKQIAYVNSNRPEWEAAMVSMDTNGSVTPAGARERLNAYLNDVAVEKSGLNLHGEVRTLSPDIAQHIDALEDQLKTLLGTGDGRAAARPLSVADRQQVDALQNEVDRLLKAPQSWVPAGLYTVEQNVAGGSIGLTFGVVVANREQASTLHLNTLLVPGALDIGAPQRTEPPAPTTVH